MLGNWFLNINRLLGRQADAGVQAPGARRPRTQGVQAASVFINDIRSTCVGVMDCDECVEQLARFAELELRGEAAAVLLPLVKDHLERCKSCREEYQALLQAHQTVSFGD